MTNIPKSSPLGQIAEGVVEQLKSTGAQVSSQMVSEPAKILEQILGGSDPQQTDEMGESTAVEQGQATAATTNTAVTDAGRLQRKQQESEATTAALYKLHQQRLQEEKQYYQEHKQEEEQEKEEEKREEEKKGQIIQLQKEKEDEAVWQQQIKAVQGSHEGMQGKM